jgi:hypothetical protein
MRAKPGLALNLNEGGIKYYVNHVPNVCVEPVPPL